VARRRSLTVLVVGSFLALAFAAGAFFGYYAYRQGVGGVVHASYRPAQPDVPAAGEMYVTVMYYYPDAEAYVPLTRSMAERRAEYWWALDTLLGGPPADMPLSERLRPRAVGQPRALEVVFRRGGSLYVKLAEPYPELPPEEIDHLGRAIVATAAQWPEIEEVLLFRGDSRLGVWPVRRTPYLYRPLTVQGTTWLCARPHSGGDLASVLSALLTAPAEGELVNLLPDAWAYEGLELVDDQVVVRLATGGRPSWRLGPTALEVLADALALTVGQLPDPPARVTLSLDGEPFKAPGTGEPFSVTTAPPRRPNPTPWPSPGEPSPVTLAAVGDVALARRVAGYIEERGLDYPLGAVAGVLGEADLTFANLEAALAEAGNPIPGKGIWLRGRPEYVEALVDAGIDVVSLANNHILDYDSPALEETLALLRSRGIAAVGAGADAEEASEPLYAEVGGLRLVFLAYTRYADIFWSWDYPRTFAAAEDLPGVVGLDPARVVQDIRRVRDEADLVVVSLHWGEEDVHQPRPDQVEMAHAFVDAGASVVLGHHPHVLQGVEVYRGSPIFYSLGNFVYDQRKRAQTETGIARITFHGARVVDVEFLPCLIDEGRPQLAAGDDWLTIARNLQTYSLPLGGQVEVEGASPPAVEILWPERN